MLDLLGGDPDFFEPSYIPIPAGLRQIAAEGFKEAGTCVFPNGMPEAEILRLGNSFTNDETGFEAFASHTHVEQYLSKECELYELARLGVDYAFFLQKSLAQSTIAGPFRVIVSASHSELDSGVGETCIVRYHRMRDGQQWLDDDLEKYREEGIAVLESF